MAGAQGGTDRRAPLVETGSRTHRSGRHWPEAEPRSFGPPLAAVDGMSTLPVMASLAIGEAGFALAARHAQALTDYWQAVSAARAPWDVLTANTDYWTRCLSDYSARQRRQALGEALEADGAIPLWPALRPPCPGPGGPKPPRRVR